MGGMRIDRLIVKAPGLPESEARQLGLHIAAGLAAAGGMPAAGDIPSLRVDAAEAPGRNLSEMARRIVGETLRQLERGA
ncbi:MAG: hypothetical protein M3178_00930 [Pseudomonadota bacterium]|nr:hypothetical protein [Pseudomonadota bacterium]